MELPSDTEIMVLVRGAQSHDPLAFDRLYDCFADPLYRYFYYRSNDQHVAEELVSETLLRMVEALPAFRFPERGQARAFSGWIFRIAYTRLVDHYRQQKRQWVELDETIASPFSADELVDRALEHEELRAAVQQLTPEQQQVVLLRFVERLSSEDVAAVTGQTVGAVKSMQHRALNAIAKTLGSARHHL